MSDANANTKVQLEMSPEMKAQFDEMKLQLEQARKDMQQERERTARAGVEAFIASITAGDKIRFGKESVDTFRAAYTDAKLAAISPTKEIAELGAKFVAHIEAMAKAQGAIVPAGEKKPAETKPDGEKLTVEDFRTNSPESNAKIATACDAYIAEHNLSGPRAFDRAFNALAMSVGIRPTQATGGYIGPDAAGDDEDDEE